ncbi:MAG: hypothetical protein ACK56F_11290 [bacterium]
MPYHGVYLQQDPYSQPMILGNGGASKAMPIPHINHIDESGFYSQQDFTMTNTNSNAKSNTYNT